MPELETYKGYKIMVDDKGEFSARKVGVDGVVEFTDETLKKLKEQIDKNEKNRVCGTEAITRNRWETGFKFGKITSVDKEKDVWISYDRYNREKVSLKTLIKKTDKNVDLIKEIVKKQEEQDKLDKEIAELDKMLERFTPEDLGYEK